MSSAQVLPEHVQRAVRSVLSGRPSISPLAHELGQQIVAGELAPGTALSEKMFGTRRNISRTSFREAIKVLAGKGLVRARQNTGTLTTTRDVWNMLDPEVLAWRIGADGVIEFIRDFLEFRRSVEPAAAEAAARRRNHTLIADIRDALERMQELESGDPFGDRYVEADVDFHKALFVSSDNEFFTALGRILEIPMFLSFTLHSQLQVGPSHRVALHEKVLVSIERGDEAAARRSIVALLTGVEADVLRAVDEVGDSAEVSTGVSDV